MAEDNSQKKSRLTKEDLVGLIREEVQSAVQPMAEQKQTDFGANIVTGKSDYKEDLSNNEQALGVARYLRSMAAGRGDPEKAQRFAQKAYDSGRWDDRIGKTLGTWFGKSLQAGIFDQAGALLPDPLAPGLIEILRSNTVVRQAGASSLPLNNGRLTIRKQTGTSTVSYVGEAQDISKTEPSVGQMVLSAKKLAAIVPISNDLLRYDADLTADEFVRNDLVERMSRREDLAFIRDDGSQFTPRGLRHWAPASHVTATNGTSATNVELDLKEMMDDLEGADIPMNNPVWLMNPRSKNHLLNLRDGNGNLVFPEVRNPTPTVYGFPVFVTTAIPKNLGNNSDESEIYFADMSQAIIAEAQNMQVDVDTSASYVENGNLVSAFSRDETAIRVIAEHDFGVRYDEAISVKNEIKWGA